MQTGLQPAAPFEASVWRLLRFLRPGWAACFLVLLSDNSRTHAGEFLSEFAQPTLDRWMYPFNATPGCRGSAPLFGSLEPESGVDSRHGQFLLGFDFTAQTVTNCEVVTKLPALLATNRGPVNYLIRSARVTVTVNRNRTFAYDPTQDAFTTYLPTNHPAFTADQDSGRPLELFGAGYRNGWDAISFWEDGPFGDAAPGQRNAFAAGYDTNGMLVDVSNNVGKTNAAWLPFEVHPFAVGTTTNVAPGELVPAGTRLHFDLDLKDPLVRQYLQEGLNAGRLRFMLTSLHGASFGGAPAWPDLFTRDNAVGVPPTFRIEGTLVGPDDSDGDGMADDAERYYFGSLEPTAEADTDGDGISNAAELAAGTDPNDFADVLHLILLPQADGTFALRFPYVASHSPIIESSTDATTWTPVPQPALHFYTLPGLVEWRDESDHAGETARLYRVRVP